MLALMFNGQAKDNVVSGQRSEPKKDENVFLKLSCDNPLDTPIL